MIRIVTEKGNISVAPNTKLSFVFKNALLQADFSARSFSFAIDAPVDKTTSETLEQLHIVESSKRVTDIAATVEFKTVQFAQGIMKLRSFTDKVIRFNIDCNDNEVTFTEQNVGTVVNDVISFADVDTMLAQFATDVNKIYPEVNYCLPMIYVKDFYGTANTDFSQGHEWFFVNQTDGNNPPTFKKNFYVSGDPDPKNYYTHVPFFFMKYIMSKIVESMGYTIGGEWFNDSLFDSAFIYNNFPLDKLTTTTYDLGNVLNVGRSTDYNIIATTGDFVIKQKAKLPSVTLNSLGIYDADEFTVSIDRIGDYTFEFDVHVVFKQSTSLADDNKRYKLKASLILIDSYGSETEIPGGSAQYFVKSNSSNLASIVASTGHHITKNLTWTSTAKDIGCTVYLRLEAENEAMTNNPDNGTDDTMVVVKSDSTFTIDLFNVYDNFNIFEPTINVGNHMPDMSVREFVREFCKQFGLYYTLNKSTNVLSFNYLENWVENTEEIDWTDKVRQGYTGDYEPVKTRGWKYDFGADTFPATTGYGLKKWLNYNYDSSENKILFKLPPVVQSSQTYNEYFDPIVTPRIDGERGASPLFGVGGTKNTAAPRWLFYWGMRRYSNIHVDSYYYNYASGDTSQRPNANGFIGTALANSDGSDSNELVLKRFHRVWNNFVDGLEPFEFDIMLDINDISQLPETMKKKIRIKNSLYVIDEIQFVTGDSIELANCKLRKI